MGLSKSDYRSGNFPNEMARYQTQRSEWPIQLNQKAALALPGDRYCAQGADL